MNEGASTLAARAPHSSRSETLYLYSARAARGFGDGFAAIILPAYLSELGFSPFQIGVIATTALLGSAVLTLTIGIGINASVFTVVNGVALRPHIYQDPDRFLRIFPTARMQGTPRAVSYAEYLALRDQSRSVRHLAALAYMGLAIGDDDLNESSGLAVSCNFFVVEGLHRPLLGRLFVPDDCRSPGQIPAAIVTAATILVVQQVRKPSASRSSVRLMPMGPGAQVVGTF